MNALEKAKIDVSNEINENKHALDRLTGDLEFATKSYFRSIVLRYLRRGIVIEIGTDRKVDARVGIFIDPIGDVVRMTVAFAKACKEHGIQPEEIAEELCSKFKK